MADDIKLSAADRLYSQWCLATARGFMRRIAGANHGWKWRVITVLENKPLERKLRHAYVALMLAPASEDGARTVVLARYGTLEVRLVEFQDLGPSDASFWIELYCRATRSSLDSCRCDDLDDADAIAESMLTCARRLH